MDRIEIIVKRKRRPRSGRTESRRKGVVKPRRNRDDLGRRRVKAGGGINFYDLGLMKVGDSYVLTPFHVAPTVEGPPADPPAVRDVESGDYAARDAFIFAGGVSGLADSFRRIERAHGELYQLGLIYGEDPGENLTMNPDEPRWTNDGLKLTDELSGETFAIFDPTGQRFFSITLVGVGKNKITATLDYGAAEVPYTPQGTDTFFLMPNLTKTGLGTVQDIDNQFWIGFTYQLIPRFPDVPSTIVEGLVPGQFTAAFELMAQQPDVKAYTIDIVSVEVPFEEAAPDNAAFGSQITYSAQDPPAGTLLAIVKQGSNYFYVWR